MLIANRYEKTWLIVTRVFNGGYVY